MAESYQLHVGDPAPWFRQRSTANPAYAFDMAAGRYIVLCFFGSAGDPKSATSLSLLSTHRHLFDDVNIAFFGVSLDPADERLERVSDNAPGIRYLWDFDGKVARLYGLLPPDAAGFADVETASRIWFVLEPDLRIMAVIPFAEDGSDRRVLLSVLENLPPISAYGAGAHAPVLLLRNVFEPEFCARLVALYRSTGGVESGFYSDVDGKTVALKDAATKRRKDCLITDEAVVHQAQARIRRRIVPEIAKVHQMKITRLERPIVACYDAADHGHFRPHRDNTTPATTHRKFAVSINLNEDFEGGELSFPEYGATKFTAPTGGAVVFSCALLHAVSPVRSGQRYAFLPFLYDDEGARLKAARLDTGRLKAADPAA